MSAKDWIEFADNLVTDFGVEFGDGENNNPSFHLKETKSGGASPIDPPNVTVEEIQINMVTTSVTKSLIDGTLIKQGDSLATVTKYSTPIKQGESIKRGDFEYIVITVDPTNPYDISIVQKLVLRLK